MSIALAEKESFWKGIAAGFLAGITVAAALRYTPLEKFISRLSTVEGTLDTKLPAVSERTPSAAEIAYAVEAAPTTGGFYSFSEPPARLQPRMRRQVEILVAQDHSGDHDAERVDHIDLSQPLHRYPRSLDMGSAG